MHIKSRTWGLSVGGIFVAILFLLQKAKVLTGIHLNTCKYIVNSLNLGMKVVVFHESRAYNISMFAVNKYGFITLEYNL